MPRTAVYSLTAAHADALQRLASDPAIAATSRLPHPYPAGAAREFIDRLLACRAEGTGYGFVVMDQGNVVGLCTLDDVRGGARAVWAAGSAGRFRDGDSGPLAPGCCSSSGSSICSWPG